MFHADLVSISSEPIYGFIRIDHESSSVLNLVLTIKNASYWWEPCKWTTSIKVKTKIGFENTFSNFTFELKFKVILKVIFQSKTISKVKYPNLKSKSYVNWKGKLIFRIKIQNQKSTQKINLVSTFKSSKVKSKAPYAGSKGEKLIKSIKSSLKWVLPEYVTTRVTYLGTRLSSTCTKMKER